MTHDELIRTQSDLIGSLLAERYRPMPTPFPDRTDVVHKLDPTDTERNTATRQKVLVDALEGFIYTSEHERKRNKITNHRRQQRKAAA